MKLELEFFNMTISQDELYGFLEQQFNLDPVDINDETLLFTEGYLDSFSIVELIGFIEDKAGIRVAASEVNLDNLDSVDRISRFVHAKSSP